MEKKRTSLGQSFFITLITAFLVLFGYFLSAHILTEMENLKNEMADIPFTDLVYVSLLLIAVYIWISLITCSAVSIVRHLNRIGDGGLISSLMWGLLIAVVAGPTLSLAAYFLGGPSYQIMIALSAGVGAGLILGLIVGFGKEFNTHALF
ncbi:hypothetical protein COB64_03070 [Candidatus Wolfebacteria bacterium]|nr:MAG: hypothetical protein COB64_03070 [Candidatus Wolfebacteria bacterium]